MYLEDLPIWREGRRRQIVLEHEHAQSSSGRVDSSIRVFHPPMFWNEIAAGAAAGAAVAHTQRRTTRVNNVSSVESPPMHSSVSGNRASRLFNSRKRPSSASRANVVTSLEAQRTMWKTLASVLSQWLVHCSLWITYQRSLQVSMLQR